MHTLFEGVVPHCLNQLFKHVVDEDLVTLQFINQSISTICSDSSAKPAVIYRVGGVGTNFIFKQKGTCIFSNVLFFSFIASQMKTLIRVLPLAIGDSIPIDDEHWSCMFITVMGYL